MLKWNSWSIAFITMNNGNYFDITCWSGGKPPFGDFLPTVEAKVANA